MVAWPSGLKIWKWSKIYHIIWSPPSSPFCTFWLGISSQSPHPRHVFPVWRFSYCRWCQVARADCSNNHSDSRPPLKTISRSPKWPRRVSMGSLGKTHSRDLPRMIHVYRTWNYYLPLVRGCLVFSYSLWKMRYLSQWAVSKIFSQIYLVFFSTSTWSGFFVFYSPW